eukprot:UC1_evm1s750
MHIADWRATFAALAGADPFDYRAAHYGGGGVLPPIDSLNQWPVISGSVGVGADGHTDAAAAQPIRDSILLGKPDGQNGAFITWPWKIVVGKQGGKGIWVGPHSPNSTKVKDNDPGCGTGRGDNDRACLFNIETDPTEHNDLSKSNVDMYKTVWAAYQKALTEKPPFQTNDTPGYKNCTSAKAYAAAHGNLGGP